MAENSPIVPSDLGAITGGLLACDALRELLNTRAKMQTFLQWFLANDPTGNLGSDFLLALSRQFLFDAAKKGFFVRTNPSNGSLELVEFIPLDSLDGSGAVEGDTLSFESGVWITRSSPNVYLAPTSGGVTLPDAAVGAVCQVAHGLSAAPRHFGCVLECTTADASYAISDRVDAATLMLRNTLDTEIAHGASVYANATVIGVNFRMAAGATPKYQLVDKSTFLRADLIPGSWNVKLYASL